MANKPCEFTIKHTCGDFEIRRYGLVEGKNGLNYDKLIARIMPILEETRKRAQAKSEQQDIEDRAESMLRVALKTTGMKPSYYDINKDGSIDITVTIQPDHCLIVLGALKQALGTSANKED